MDSYNLFGDDGSGMLEGLTDLGSSSGYAGNPTTEQKNNVDNSYRQQYNPVSVSNEAGGKLGQFSGGGGGAGGEYHEYTGYRPRAPPPAPLHHPHYPGYLAAHPPHPAHPAHPVHPADQPMYTMPEHQGMGDMPVWSSSPGPNRYSAMAPVYRHNYEHQQKLHQYPPQQGSNIAGMQASNNSFIPRQPHFPQPPSQNVYGQQQGYPNYSQMHPASAARMSQHPPYHGQMEVGGHQYNLGHNQQGHGGGHQLQHGAVHVHHAPPPMHHPRAPPPASFPPQHHNMPPLPTYQHQVQHPLDVNVANQYNLPKPTLETGNPQYRPPFHQISPQVSPRAQISPRPQAPQSSPRPVISPVKNSSASPHGARNIAQSPSAPVPTPVSVGSFPTQNTLQALEQMVLPAGNEYYHRNSGSPSMSQIPPTHSNLWNQQTKPPMNYKNSSVAENEDPPKTNVEIIEKAPNTDGLSVPKEQVETHQMNDKNDTENFGKTVPNKSGTIEDPNKNDSFFTDNTSTLSGETVNTTQPVDTAVKMSTENVTNETEIHVDKQSDTDAKEENNSTAAVVADLNNSNKNTTPLPADVTPQTGLVAKSHVATSAAQGTSDSTNSEIYRNIPPRSQEFITTTSQNIAMNNPILTTGSNITSMPNVQHSPMHANFSNVIPSVIPVPNQINQNMMNNNIPPNTSTNPTSGINCLPGLPTGPPNIANNLTNIQSNTSQPLPSHHIGMPLGVPPMHTALPPNIPPGIHNPPNVMPHNINPNITMMVGNNAMPHGPVQGLYPPPHHQERASLQQQIQELYCLPPSAENQEKVRCYQERLVLLQQHETNDKCNGGPNCLLQNPGYTKMIDSPQVTSTTGRGRGKGPAKPRKPRAKKEKVIPLTPMQPLDQLPVSEDHVSAGTGVQGKTDIEESSQLDGSLVTLEAGSEKVKKPRTPRKAREPRKPRTPREPKTKLIDGELKPIRERKKRTPRDPNAPRKRRTAKKEIVLTQADTTTSNETLEKNTDVSITAETSNLEMEKIINDDTVTDFDDIPVSKIAIKDLLQEADAKREQNEDSDSYTPQRKRTSRKRGGGSGKKISPKRVSIGGRRRRRGGIVPDSDGEPDDLVTTPPPSPTAEGDDSLKRRSARHTQRKKYTDDVLLRLSDDDIPNVSTPKLEKDASIKSFDEGDIKVKSDIIPKPNYIYVNTTDEDAMIVQYVLASRMGKREVKIGEVPKLEIKQETTEEDNPALNETITKEITENDDYPAEVATDNDSSKVDTESTNVTEDKTINEKEVKVDKQLSPDEDVEVKKDTLPSENKTDGDDSNEQKTMIVDVEEYYVKYRNFSYLHCEWKTEEELYKGDKRIFSKIKRFKQKQAQQMNIFEFLDDEPFNPDYIEVERILDVSENGEANEVTAKHYLVKWKSLQYEDSTWELEEDVDVDKIKQFKEFNDTPPKEKWKFKRKPSPDNWVQLNESPLYKGGNTLRPYQLEGLNWLLFSWHNNRNCILADEMGLGKTIQSLTFVHAVWQYGIRGPFLIIAPLSTIPNWQREFEGWTDMNVIVYHGSQQSKSMIQEYEFFYKDENGKPIKEITKFNVLITTFEIIVTDFQELMGFNWRLCVIDEAHRLKNRNCKLLEGLRQLHLEHRVLLSGTPLQNNVNELFSLLNFLEPSQFSSNEAFLNDFGQLKTESEVLKLQALLKPMMLRRLKEDVEKGLAPKEETIIEVELTNIQKKYYRAILERNFSFLQKGIAAAANIPNLMNTMMELRKCCIHPYLLNGAEDQIQFDYKQAHGEDKEAYYKALIQSSGKMVLVDKLLPKLKAGGHRVLVFSQMVRCLDILEDYLMFKKYPYERIDGRIRGNLRQEAIDRFSKPDSDRFVFLLCTKAGGLGINLTAADTVIIYDSDWNPQNDLQAQARCHRIGQQKMVKIYRLICRNTYEREMFDKASLKLGLDKAILQSMNTTQGKETGLKQLSKKEIEDLLKKGAYGAVMDEDNAGDKFCEEDIEMILARRTQVIQMESEKGSTFSKASFASNDQRSDIDIRDPDFWNKWAKKAEIDTTEKKEDEDLIVTEPRKRTVIKRYGHDDGTVEMSDEATPDSEEDEEGMGLRSKRKKDKLGRKGRKYGSDDYIPRHEGVPMDDELVYGAWTRSECFKIERGLLTFGWGRWDEIVDGNQFRKGWTIPVVEDCARVILLFCLRHYKGDEKIRNFIWDLIEPCENGEVTISRNHSGLHNPVPRGRNAKKKNRPKDIQKSSDTPRWENQDHWCSNEKYDCEAYLESSYKKHLYRHANKVLLRVRMMYYIKHEVIGDYAAQIESGAHASTLGLRVPRGVDSAPPRAWWDTECDVSLLVGSYVHGYENYLAMRSDPKLCFIDKLGPPDDAECTDIKRGAVESRGEEEGTDEVSSAGASPERGERGDDLAVVTPWPSMQDLNTRLRRLITAYQRNYKREELRLQQRAKKMERRDRSEQYVREESSQWRWSKSDEEAFRRTVASYGVEFDPSTKSLRWNRFRALARLETKSDDALTDYLKAFMAMCKRQCGLAVGEAELPTRADLKAEPIGEERAIATLERIDLLRVLREEVAPHAALEARLALCERGDTPPWWTPATHDKLLVLGVCRHGLGDTYHKIFCDPKLPFADCAAKWYSTRKPKRNEAEKDSSDEDNDNSKHRDKIETRMSLRRSTRNSNTERENEDTDALSELESLAKLGRNEDTLPANSWFTERALETRLHHIAHAVQNCEWPGGAAQPKKHIAIDVETERAKLHALLSSGRAPSPAPVPAPPPAHRPAPAQPAADQSAPLDLSEPAAPHAPPAKGRLDDTLDRLMKRKNVPAPEQIVGKEKKRKKLDEIVLGLSAAKGQNLGSSSSSTESPRQKSSPHLPNVSLTPTSSHSPSISQLSQKPFSVTVTSIPSPQSGPKDLSSFLQQSLEHYGAKTPKQSSTPPKSISHEAKVNKWLSEQANQEARRMTPSPRLAPDEHVPVVHRVTGKRLVGNKAPQLKHLAQWIAENHMYDIDPKWTESIKEHVKLPQDVRSPRPSPVPSTSSSGERKKGRPPSLDSASHSVLSSSHLNQSLAGLNPALLASLSAFDPKTLAATLSNLSGFDPKILSSFDPKLLASLSSFDPKNNPLLGSFGGMPNLLGGNLFANLAGLGIPGLSSLDMSSLNTSSSSTDKKSRKPSESAGSSSKSSSQFPFVFPNPSMLYPQLGLGGLNPFSMHSGLASTYDALGLLGNNMAPPSSTNTSHSSSRSSGLKSSGSQKVPTSTVTTSSSHSRTSKSHSQPSHMQQILLPPDTYLLDSLSKHSYEAMMKAEKKTRDECHEATDLSKLDKKKTNYDSLRSHLPPEFAAVQEKLLKGDKKDIDISKMLLEQMASGALSASLVSSAEGKKFKDSESREIVERMAKSEFLSKALSIDEISQSSSGNKRKLDITNEPENLSVGEPNSSKKRSQESPIALDKKSNSPQNTSEMDLEDLIAPSTVIRTGGKTSDYGNNKSVTSENPDAETKTEIVRDLSKSPNDVLNVVERSNAPPSKDDVEDSAGDNRQATDETEQKDSKKKQKQPSEDVSHVGLRRELRSNASRSGSDTQ